MPLVRCSSCQQRSADKTTQTTWAWRNADGVRRAWRMRLCTACVTAKLAPLSLDYATVERLTCPQCGIDTEEDYDAVWATAYIPGYGKHEIEAPFCGACAAMFRIWVQEHGWELEDQGGATGSPPSRPSATEVLQSLGIEPHA